MGITKKNIIVVVLLLLLAAAIYLYTEYNRKASDIRYIETDIKVTAVDMVGLYESDEAAANKKYLGKVVEVTGAIAEIINQQDTLVNVLLGDPLSLHKVSCLMAAGEFSKVKQYNTGLLVGVKGICNGYLMDVELSRCVIVHGKK